MSYSQAITLAVVQGLTEFLPISSSGHLVIFQKLFGLATPPVFFDILVHVGTLGAIILFFRKELKGIFDGLRGKKRKSRDVLLMVVIGTIPAGLVGLFLQEYLSQIFNSLNMVGVSLLITAGLLFSTKFIPHHISGAGLNWKGALFVGSFQALAILPGISRSGATIVAGLWRRLDREEAFYFSFYLAIPAIVGALVLQIPALVQGQFNYSNQAILGMLIAGVIGYFALLVLKRVLLKGKLWLFGFYCLFLAFPLLI